jgi:hypothetical protein
VAGIASVLRERRQQLRQLKTQITQTQAGYHQVEREITRLINRKSSFPESEDLVRLVQFMVAADQKFDAATRSVETMASGWR